MPKVLIVDDAAVDRRFAAGLVEESEGVEVLYAENGESALECIGDSRPDVVVTDLQMPVMDGLELVSRIRLTNPDIPVVLMTAKGSEQVAVQALEQGASSYVPKSELARSLRETVEDLLAIKNNDHTYSRLMACQERIELEFSLDNNAALIDGLIDLVQQVIEGMQLTDHTGKFRIGVALREALLNALYRGNLEVSFEEVEESREQMVSGSPHLVERRRSESPYCDRKIQVLIKITRNEARFVVKDEGPGFDHRAMGRPTDAEGALDSTKGRGVVLMHSFMDEVEFNDVGNQITLVKRRDQG
jgi:CheY-like chemotaxis protein